MRQYLDVKARYPDAIVFFRLGDFYEMFHEDAVYAARVLDLTLTTRDKGKEDPVPMCGIPHHAVRPYLVKLTELGHRVALCEQLEDPRAVKRHRQARRRPRRHPGRDAGRGVAGPARAQLRRRRRWATRAAATGWRSSTSPPVTFAPPRRRRGDALLRGDRSGRAARAGVRPRRRWPGARRPDPTPLTRAVPRTNVAPGDDGAELARVLGPAVAGGLAERTPRAAAARRRPCCATRAPPSRGSSCRSRALDVYGRTDTLIIDEQARRHLELTESLLDRRRVRLADRGARREPDRDGWALLRRWLLFPSVDVAAIRRRHDAVERLVAAHAARDAARRVLARGRGHRTPGRAGAPGRGDAARSRGARALAGVPAGPARGARGRGRRRDRWLAGRDESLLSLGDDLAAEIAAELERVLRPDAPAADQGRRLRQRRACRPSSTSCATSRRVGAIASPPSRRASANAPGSRR